MSGAAKEFYHSLQNAAYPFEAALANDFHKLLVDAYVLHSRAREQLRVRLSSFDPAGTVELRFEDGSLLAALVQSDGFFSSVFGAYTLYQWQRSSTIGAGFTSEDIVVRIVVKSDRLADHTYPASPSEAYLLPSLVNPRLSRVRRIGVAVPGAPCCVGGGIVAKEVVLDAGYNVELTQDNQTAVQGIEADEETVITREPEEIVVNLEAGGGIGRFPNCTSGGPIVSINKVTPDSSGNLRLEGKDCTWVETRVGPTTGSPINPGTNYLGTVLDALLQLHQRCKACCDCSDYGQAYSNLRNVYLRAKELAERLEAIRVRYNQACTQYNDLKAARENGLQVRLAVVSRPDFSLAIMATAFNNSPVAIGTTSLNFTISRGDTAYTPRSGYVEAENSHNVQMNPIGGGSAYRFTLPGIGPGKYASYSFHVRFTGTERTGALVRTTVVATSGVQSSTDQKSATLQPPLTKT